MRWLLPALIVPMLIAGACRGDSKQLPIVEAEDVVTESSVEGRGLPPFDTTENDVAVGQLAPIATGVDLLTNELVRVAPEGRPLVVAFFAHWCPHCQREVAAITEWLLANKLPSSVDLFAISTFEAPERGNHPPASWLREEGWKHPVIADSSSLAISDAFGVMSVPYFVFIEADGTVAFRISGNLGPRELSAAMKRLAGTSI